MLFGSEKRVFRGRAEWLSLWALTLWSSSAEVLKEWTAGARLGLPSLVFLMLLSLVFHSRTILLSVRSLLNLLHVDVYFTTHGTSPFLYVQIL